FWRHIFSYAWGGPRPRSEHPSRAADPGGESVLCRNGLQFGKPGEISGRRPEKRRCSVDHGRVDRKRRKRGRTCADEFVTHGGGEQRDVHSRQGAHSGPTSARFHLRKRELAA